MAVTMMDNWDWATQQTKTNPLMWMPFQVWASDKLRAGLDILSCQPRMGKSIPGVSELLYCILLYYIMEYSIVVELRIEVWNTSNSRLFLLSQAAAVMPKVVPS
jgi:hypothetical protein